MREEFKRFDRTVRKILLVSREELKAREANWKANKQERSATKLKAAVKKHESAIDRLAAKAATDLEGHVHFNRSAKDDPLLKVANEVFQKAAKRQVN
jgi:phosphoenolpyruvate-protein kinase (PTS system EI component)